jgi:formylglycine-generating enzyme required for sulfatase activity
MGIEMRVAPLVAVGAWALACSFDLPPARDTPGPADGSPALPDSGIGSDGPPLAPDAGASDAPSVPCPEAGAIRVGTGVTSFCIDATEVTDEQYLAFLAADRNKGMGKLLPQCQWNFLVQPGAPPAADSLPVVNVNWCDAYAYCAWAGKHLCGTPRSEWTAACSHEGDGAHAYPYGNAFDPTACNVGKVTIGGLAPAASNPRCVGGYPGLFDMAGNAAEWEDACDDDGGAAQDTPCNVRGGAWDEEPRPCAYVGQLTRQTRVTNVGFRCCF